ncbi:hypothetical protein EDB81DRAFT_911683 [Dactylonectria macrodidyma]|uniref:NADH:flavin oxidoreductase/NADH oxidase N-terminal domain-containing protein n=1 Tax=Dactylonectria macrodidyma TaxID=307937 RepID=A0A9P9DTC2_9HYPO|nr:hypothetical protein EDB81DRAFT_911683 [Dactylonectria macrodidyma]
MVDDKYLGSPGDVAVSGPDSIIVEGWTAWAKSVREQGCCIIAQLNHPGRQSPVGAGKRSPLSKTLAPSAIPLNLGDSWIARVAQAVLFGTPQTMTLDQIDDVIMQFTRAARLAFQAGFDGVEINAGHGFLLSQFLSSSTNKRSDEFGGSAENRAELLLRILRAIRREVPQSFCVGVKINTADHMNPGGFNEMLRQIKLIHMAKTDYIQLTGGSFEDPQMLSTRNSLPTAGTGTAGRITREGFFIKASERIRLKFPHLLLIVTGGFRSREGVNNALKDGACDAIGLGRPAVKFPDLPNKIMFNGDLVDEEARFDVEAAPSPGWIATKVRSVGAGAETVS